MAEALKNFFDARLIESLARDLHRVHPDIDERGFVADGLRGLPALALLARGSHLADVMKRHLPEPYERAARLLIDSLGPELDSSQSFGMAPFRYLPHVFFVARYGIDHFELSMRAQRELTKRFSAESSIRAFLVKYPERTLARLREWATDPNVHVRRLVSEGTRPRLPWAMRLRDFQKDPRPVLELLEMLKDDPERYVQRSVANNLNDIGKDHPDVAVEVCSRWWRGASAERRWIVKHALRSLLKRGDRGALKLLGVAAAPAIVVQKVELTPPRLRIGSSLSISFELMSTITHEQDLLVDYAVFFVKADGRQRAKVFKLRRVSLGAKARVHLGARVSFTDMTTRKHHPGRHRVELLVNGEPFDLGEFDVRA